MSSYLDTMANSNLTTQTIHYGNKMTYLSIVGGRDWRTKHGNLSRINNCRSQHVWSSSAAAAPKTKTTNDLVDLAIYLFCRKNTNRFEIHTSVLVELFNFMKEMASYNKKLTILLDSNLQLADNNSAIDAILFMGKHLDIIRGLEFATSSLIGNNNNNKTMIQSSQIINKITEISTSLEYFGLEIVLPSKKNKDSNDDDDGRHTWIFSNVLTNNTSIQNLYLKISDDDKGSFNEEAYSSRNKNLLIEIGNRLKANTCIKNLSITFSKSENLFWIFDALIRNDDDNNDDVCGHHHHHSSIETLTLIYTNEVQLHHALVDYIVPILVSPNCPIIELELGAVNSNIVIQNPSFLIELLLPGIKRNKSLKRLTLQRNKLTETDVDKLLCCLYESDNSSLTSLNLEYNHIRSFEFVNFLCLIEQQQQWNDSTAFKLGVQETNVQNNPIQWNIRRIVRNYNSQYKLLRICPHLYSFGWDFETLWGEYAGMQMLKKQQGPLACTPFVLQTMADTNRCRREVFSEVDNMINPVLLPNIIHRIKRRLNIDYSIRRQSNIIYQLLQRNPAILDYKESM